MHIEKTNKRTTVRVGAAVAALTLLLLLAVCLEKSVTPPTNVGPAPSPAVTGSHGGEDKRVGGSDEPKAASFGLCPICFEEVVSPTTFVECAYCCEYTLFFEPEFDCGVCGMKQSANSFSKSDIWVYHSLSICESLVWYPLFVSFNSGDGQNTGEDADMMTIIEINGEFDRNGAFHTYPWYTYEALPSSLTLSVSGEYAVHVYDSNDERLAVTRFDAKDGFRFLGPDTAPMASSAIPVRLVVRFNEQAARIAILKGDIEIYSRNVSKSPPEVKFTGLKENQSLLNKTAITWDAADFDGEELYFRLWYCTGKNEYFLLASDITGRSFSADFTDYPGSKNGYFHIYATDGVRTTQVKSPVVSTPFKPPVIITEQKTIDKFKITEEIYFPVEIYDAQDGRLLGSNVIWLLDGEQFGANNVLHSWPYRLTAGVHTFTCVATNLEGLSAKKEFSFEVVDDQSDLPDDWSRDEIVHALKNGYVVPINRIDSPVTRGQYADIMHTLFYNLYPEILPDYDKNLITDCTEYSYSEFLMAYLGVMEAPDGIFEPHKSLTQREALRIIYLTYMLAQNTGLKLEDISYSEVEASALLESEGIFDSDNNTYEPDTRLSKKQALVWISRVDKWLLR